MTAEFVGFPKITRYENVSCVLTEKIDGTNGCLIFSPEGKLACQSRNRIITPNDDNFGFASWAYENHADLFEFFGPGRHYGEWWGLGIQRGYGLIERRFSPFNTHMFSAERPGWPRNTAPLPVLGQFTLSVANERIESAMHDLAMHGSLAAPGFRPPEGAMLWSRETGYLKVPFEKSHKWQLAA